MKTNWKALLCLLLTLGLLLTAVACGDSQKPKTPETNDTDSDEKAPVEDGSSGNETSAPPSGTEEPSETSAAPNSAMEEYWEGGWYGRWTMKNCTGEYLDLEGCGWDICARIDVDAEGAGTMVLWDEAFAADNPLGEVAVQIVTDGEDVGYLSSVSGWFDLGELALGTWTADPKDSVYSDCLVLGGRIEIDEASGYDYSIVLRPWGTRWEDADELPYYYESWYLPLIDAGEEMPDHFDADVPAG